MWPGNIRLTTRPGQKKIAVNIYACRVTRRHDRWIRQAEAHREPYRVLLRAAIQALCAYSHKFNTYREWVQSAPPRLCVYHTIRTFGCTNTTPVTWRHRSSWRLCSRFGVGYRSVAGATRPTFAAIVFGLSLSYIAEGEVRLFVPAPLLRALRV